MRVVFFGTPNFSADILLHLLEKNIDIVAVVTMPDRPKGRSSQPQPSAVKILYLEKNLPIPLFQPEKASTLETISALKSLNPDLFIVVGYGEILSEELLRVPRLYPINIHTSLLPKYRGAAPIQRAIMAGEAQMGITIMQMNPEMDAGAILSQSSCHISEDLTFPDIERMLNQLAKTEVVKVIEECKRDALKPRSQDLTEVTKAPKIKPEDSRLDLRQAAPDLHHRIRALTPKPATYLDAEIDGVKTRIKIYLSKIHDRFIQEVPGKILEFSKKSLIIACGHGALSILALQLEGKKRVDVPQFYAGFSQKKLIFLV
ncbi:MAG: methionyl-tRNA formyltransferase [Simkaniaceae bacterium]|nr:methionyl-tRNA formyltransferase [Simkaniaceae bacterium]MCF7851896.1 methionyl-tRNA formyltransferase [Simkaniaceae bacterium]